MMSREAKGTAEATEARAAAAVADITNLMLANVRSGDG